MTALGKLFYYQFNAKLQLLLLEWMTVCGQVDHLVYYQPPSSTQPIILPRQVN